MDGKISIADTIFIDVETAEEQLEGECDTITSAILEEFLPRCAGVITLPLKQTERYKSKNDCIMEITAELTVVSTSFTQPSFWVDITIPSCPHEKKCTANYRLIADGDPDTQDQCYSQVHEEFSD